MPRDACGTTSYGSIFRYLTRRLDRLVAELSPVRARFEAARDLAEARRLIGTPQARR